MAAQDTNLTIPANEWTKVTDNLVSAMRLVNIGPYDIWLKATTGTTAPTDTYGAVPLKSRDMWAGDLTVSQLFGGVSTTTAHIWVWSDTATTVSVSHAA